MLVRQSSVLNISYNSQKRINTMDISTTYMGLTLESPVIVGSSGLTDSVEKLKKIEEAGAGAAVLKSIFEEEIAYEYNDIIKEVPLTTG